MINFKQFLNEARAAPLYHGTALRLFDEMMDSGIQARTYHRDHVVGKAPHRKDNKGRLMMKDSLSHNLTFGISTTRRYEFARRWIRSTLEEPGVIIEFDQQKLTHRYKMVPVNFYGWGRDKTRTQNDSHTLNEFEEFIIMKKDEKLPWGMVKQLHLPISEDWGPITEWANEKNIRVVFDPHLFGRN